MTADIESMSELVQWGLLQVCFCRHFAARCNLRAARDVVATHVDCACGVADRRVGIDEISEGVKRAYLEVRERVGTTCRPFKKTLRECE